MTNLYHFFKMMMITFWSGITLILCSEFYLAYTGNPRPDWLLLLESFYYWLWVGFLKLKDQLLGGLH